MHYITNNIASPTNADDRLVSDYFPNTEMIKVFNGGYENSGGIDIVDKVTKNKVQIKQIDTGTGMGFVYEVTPSEITLIYAYSLEGSYIEQDYFSVSNNRENIIIKGPIKKGTKWFSDGISYEITGIDVMVNTPAGKFETIEVTHNKGDFIRYYAKGLGLVKTKVLGFDSELIKVDYEIEKIKKVDNLFELIEIYLFK